MTATTTEMTRYVTVEPDWLFDGEALVYRGKLTFDESGRIVGADQVPDDAPTTHLRFRNKAIIPGFTNAHSHAFQRLIRGRTHEKAMQLEDFWTWRRMMMTAVSRMTPEDLYSISYLAFVEMLLAGYTTVGEFHYIHRQVDGNCYDEPNYLGKIVIQAAQDAGIRIVLLRVAYCRSGFSGAPPEGGQKRFVEPDPEQVLCNLDELQSYCSNNQGTGGLIGVAPHSVRAVSGDDLRRFFSWAEQHRTPFHIHAAEQPGEVKESLAYTGKRPVEHLASIGVLSPNTTLVHATHVTDSEIREIANTLSTVCVCPTTEADLGDGLLPAGPMVQQGIRLALGSDSQAIIDPFCEMRMLETGERMRTGQRICLTGPPATSGNNRLSMPQYLMRCGTVFGHQSLNPYCQDTLPLLSPGLPADFVVLDLHHPSLAGCTGATLIPSLALHGAPSAVTDVWVQGRRRVCEGNHLGYKRVLQEVFTVCDRIFGS